MFGVRLTPRGGRYRIEGVVNGELRVRVAAPPADGAANAALLRLLAHELDVPGGAVRLTAGESSRHKRVAIEGLSPDRVRARWPDLSV